ncbi:sporulation protein YpjB [Paenibacillus sp. NPDC058071]|uniref:sporulation protein YpjB n=1 Tax=Paenibacillus sp. NPDC058071 TaxID=3346326 RepID=UPI0036DB1EDB
MKIRMALAFTACIVMTFLAISAMFHPASQAMGEGGYAGKQSLLRLDKTAEQLYQAAYTNNRQAGYKYVQQLEKQMDSVSLRDVAGQSEGWRLLEDSVSAVEASLHGGRSGTSWMLEAARIHLTTDALIRPQHALWLQYEKLMLEDLQRVKRAWNRQTGDGAAAARAAMDSFTAHLAKIEAAAAVQRPGERIAQLKERMRYTNVLLDAGVRGQSKQDWTEDSIADLRDSLVRLFDDGLAGNEEPAFSPVAEARPIAWVLLLGAVISGVLAYNGWRQYKYRPYGIKKR